VEHFIHSWNGLGRPDMAKLPILVDAWNRSHYLFDQPLTDYLRRLWLDASKADWCNRVIAGEVDGDREQAIGEARRLMAEHMEVTRLRDQFLAYLKLSGGSVRNTAQTGGADGGAPAGRAGIRDWFGKKFARRQPAS
jgi:hypothetical protein